MVVDVAVVIDVDEAMGPVISSSLFLGLDHFLVVHWAVLAFTCLEAASCTIIMHAARLGNGFANVVRPYSVSFVLFGSIITNDPMQVQKYSLTTSCLFIGHTF